MWIPFPTKLYNGLERFQRWMQASTREVQQLILAHGKIFGEEGLVLLKNKHLLNLYRGRRAFVLGNGPSLNEVDIHRLSGELLFTVNDFGSHPAVRTIQPTIHCFADPNYFKYPDNFRPVFLRVLDNLPNTIYVMPTIARAVVQELGLFPEERSYYCRLVGSMGHHQLMHVDLTKPILGAQTVSHLALAVAIYTGCNPIYLMGMDMSWLAHPNKQIHFSSVYEADAKPIHINANLDYCDHIESGVLVFQGFRALKRAADARGQQIYNASSGGFLDVFPRIPFETALQPIPQVSAGITR